jgi:membrane protein
MSNIDRTFNVIWGVRSKRRLVSKFLIYWAVLTLGPVLIVASVLATSQLVVLAGLSDVVVSSWGERLLKVAPVGTSLLAFTLIYGVVPNVRVRLRHALTGGAVAAVLFELAKRGFALYIKAFPTYEAIYGALAAVPIFLLWLYLSWTVVLIGAEVAHALRMYHWNKPEPRGAEMGLLDAVYVLLLLDEAAAEGRTLSIWQLTELREQWREDQIQELLADMAERRWVHQTRDGKWSLTRRLADFSLYDVMTEGRFVLPQAPEGHWERLVGLDDHLDAARSGVRQALDVSLTRFRLARAEPKAINPAKQA